MKSPDEKNVRLCLYCKRELLNKRKKAKYCSVSCSNKHKGRLIEKRNHLEGKTLQCKLCKKHKNPRHFSYKKRGDINSGKKEYCHRCGANEREKKRRNRTWKDDAVKVLLSGSKQRAKRANIKHTLTRDDIVIPDRCPVFGTEMKREGRKTWKNAPSIDRIDNNEGYTKENIVIVSRRANILKKDASIEELKLLSDFYCRK